MLKEILVIDDNPDIRFLICNILAEQNFKVRSAANYEPHLICYYLRQLAGTFHSYYNNEKILVEEENALQARLFLISAVRQVVFNGLTILGISAPEKM